MITPGNRGRTKERDAKRGGKGGERVHISRLNVEVIIKKKEDNEIKMI